MPRRTGRIAHLGISVPRYSSEPMNPTVRSERSDHLSMPSKSIASFARQWDERPTAIARPRRLPGGPEEDWSALLTRGAPCATSTVRVCLRGPQRRGLPFALGMGTTRETFFSLGGHPGDSRASPRRSRCGFRWQMPHSVPRGAAPRGNEVGEAPRPRCPHDPIGLTQMTPALQVLRHRSLAKRIPACSMSHGMQ
jgi:hypothetical protein